MSSDGDGADDGPERRPLFVERQRAFDVRVESVGLKVDGRWWPW